MVFPKVASVEDMKRVAEAYVKNKAINKLQAWNKQREIFFRVSFFV